MALLFKSEEGMGKDMFYNLLKNMIGGDFCGNTIKVERDVLGDFNSFLTNKVLVVINELKGSVGYKYSDDLKFHITSETADIRRMRTDVKANGREEEFEQSFGDVARMLEGILEQNAEPMELEGDVNLAIRFN